MKPGSTRGQQRVKSEDTKVKDSIWEDYRTESNWKPPKPVKEAWEELIVSVDTIEAD